MLKINLWFPKLYFYRFIKRMALRLAPVSHRELVLAGFDDSALFYRLADLNIYFARDKYFYHKPSGRRKTVRNMLQVSNLIYGKSPYLHV